MKTLMTAFLYRDFERQMHPCPEVNPDDISKFPPLSDEAFLFMESVFREDMTLVYAFPFVRGDFIEIWIWDALRQGKEMLRFVICEGYRMTEIEERLFLRYTRREDLRTDEPLLWRFAEAVDSAFPEWHYPVRPLTSPRVYDSLAETQRFYSAPEIGKALEHVYFASHRSGCREILYKAGLNRIAYQIDRIIGHNMIGTTPERIVGWHVPMKLLRIWNCLPQYEDLSEEERLRESMAVYQMFAGYLGGEIPSSMQWAYLCELFRGKGQFGGHGFLRALYRRLDGVRNVRCLEDYRTFFMLRGRVAGLGRIRIPQPEDVYDTIQYLSKMRKYQEQGEAFDKMIRQRRAQSDLEYTGTEYVVMLPESGMDICREALAQNNCAMDYLERHAKGEDTILFLRKKDNPTKSYVTMEIDEVSVRQVFARSNSFPEPEVLRFLEKYARKKGILFDPFLVYGEDWEFDEPEDAEKLEAYLAEYQQRYGPPEFEEEEWLKDAEQMTLTEWMAVKCRNETS